MIIFAFFDRTGTINGDSFTLAKGAQVQSQAGLTVDDTDVNGHLVAQDTAGVAKSTAKGADASSVLASAAVDNGARSELSQLCQLIFLRPQM